MISKIVVISVLFLNILYSSSFEQNGVKEGNSRVSIGIYGERHYSQDKSGLDIKFDGSYGRFISNSSEVLLKIKDSTDLKEHLYKIDAGYSFYFFKHLLFAPYIGLELGISGNTRLSSKTTNEEGIYIGVHNFLTESIALTPEIGMEYSDFKTPSESYLNIYLTYFFD